MFFFGFFWGGVRSFIKRNQIQVIYLRRYIKVIKGGGWVKKSAKQEEEVLEPEIGNANADLFRYPLITQLEPIPGILMILRFPWYA